MSGVSARLDDLAIRAQGKKGGDGMALKRGLIRSYYGWLTKVETELREERGSLVSSLPPWRPTTLPAVTRLALRTAGIFRGTRFQERAEYWSSLFQRIYSEGWKGDLSPQDKAGFSIREELEQARGLAL